MNKYFYRLDSSTEVGKKFRRLWNECIKADRAAEVFTKKAGAKTWYPDDAAFAGGVACVSFETEVNKKLWRSLGKDADGLEQWEPAVSRRGDVMVLPRKDFRPSDTATRVFERRVLPWAMVRHLHTQDEWAEMTGIKLTGDKTADAKRMDDVMSHLSFMRYVELYRDDFEKKDDRVRMPYYVRESIRIERARLLLPVVKTEQIYRLLQADTAIEAKNPVIVQDQAPTFFEYNKRVYIGIDYPCKADGLKEIDRKAYIMAKDNLLRMQRDMEALAKSGAKGS